MLYDELHSSSIVTLAKTKIIYPKNVRTKVAMDFTYDKYLAPRIIEEMKILGAVLELPTKQHCQFIPFTSKLGQIGQIGSAVKLAAPKWHPGF